jgi:hypothetical protein
MVRVRSVEGASAPGAPRIGVPSPRRAAYLRLGWAAVLGVALAVGVGCGPAGRPPVAEAPPRGELGDACVVDADCAGGSCDRTVPGGYCTLPCENSAQCGAGGVCDSAAEGGLGVCFKGCTSQRDCRSREFQCFRFTERQGVCSFDVTRVAPGAPNVGAPCRATVECAAPGGLEPFCVPEVAANGRQTGHTGGLCVALGCTDDQACGDGATCVTTASSPFCAQRCEQSADCREGYSCVAEAGACLPAR